MSGFLYHILRNDQHRDYLAFHLTSYLFCSIIIQLLTDVARLNLLYLFSMKSLILLGSWFDGRIYFGRWLVMTVFYMSTSIGSLYFFAHSTGTPYSLLDFIFRLTLSPYLTKMGFPFSRRSISVWWRLLGSMNVRWLLLLSNE
jgi:hypothetical protein